MDTAVVEAHRIGRLDDLGLLAREVLHVRPPLVDLHHGGGADLIGRCHRREVGVAGLFDGRFARGGDEKEGTRVFLSRAVEREIHQEFDPTGGVGRHRVLHGDVQIAVLDDHAAAGHRGCCHHQCGHGTTRARRDGPHPGARRG